MSNFQFQRYKEGTITLKDILQHKQAVICVHYSCESFYERPSGLSPRVTVIALRFLGTGQTKSFSIHQQAELSDSGIDDISDQYDHLEKKMLKRFYDFVKQYSTYKWMHWNMRDGNYGFEALTHRYSVLGGTPEDIQDAQKIDLARVMHQFLGPQYVPHPRMAKLLERNNMTPRNFISGAEEAEAFADREYVKLHQSTLSKVDAIADIAEAAVANRLLCDNNYFTRRGLTISTAGDILKDHPAIALLPILAALIAVWNFFDDLTKLIN